MVCSGEIAASGTSTKLKIFVCVEVPSAFNINVQLIYSGFKDHGNTSIPFTYIDKGDIHPALQWEVFCYVMPKQGHDLQFIDGIEVCIMTFAVGTAA